MARTWLMVVALQTGFAAPAAARTFEPLNSHDFDLASPPAVAPLQAGLQVISYRVETEAVPDGSLRRRSGIIAGYRFAPGAMVGVGFFGAKSRPKSSLSDQGTTTKGSRKAAVSVSLKF